MKIDLIEIMKQIKENHKKLNGCSRHDFSIDITPDKKVDKRYRCTNCNGEVSATDKYWYDKGLEDVNK